MNAQIILPSGWVGAATFIIGSLLLGSLLPDYSAISQTVSEIGQSGSTLYGPWQIFTLSIGGLLILFSVGIYSFASQHKLSVLPGLFILAAGISQFGIGLYPSPHQLHNVFGLSMILGYLSPIAMALSWKERLGKSFQRISYLSFILIMIGIFLNLSPAFAQDLYPLSYYGLVQRFLLYTFYLYIFFVSLIAINFSPENRMVD